jgi:hypothetical protein
MRVQGAAIKGQAGIGLQFIGTLYKANGFFFTLNLTRQTSSASIRMI